MVRPTYDVRAVEARWRAEWERAGCHLAPQVPVGEKYFVHDATPFPNGPLHMGHVRSYVLGDVMARYQRLRGKCVLYHTGFDSFGLPIELEAIERAIPPRQLVRHAIEQQTEQFGRLGISYDPTRLADSSDPEVYRWTQWLFLEMHRAGLVEHRAAPVNWCPQCATTLARTQVENGACWRCETPIVTRELPQWFVATSRYHPQLRRTLDALTGWSDHARRAIAAMLDDTGTQAGARGQGGADWLVSRQRSWGTPIPIVYCDRCGAMPVPAADLPVQLPDDLDWASGSGALGRAPAFVETSCPGCGAAAKRETDTLDCVFDDQWCYFQTLVLRAATPGFTRENLTPWLPVDCSQSGRDTYAWFHIYRFFGAYLKERGTLDEADYIHRFFGHDMVLAEGKKMSKHLGNAVDPASVIDTHGADTLRVAMLWAAGPQRAVQWNPQRIERAATFLSNFHKLCNQLAAAPSPPEPTAGPATVPRKTLAVMRAATQTFDRVAQFIEEYRPNAAIEALATLLPRITTHIVPRLATNDGGLSRAIIDDYTIALAPFAPHLAEETWHQRGNTTLVAQAKWPTPP